MQSKYVCIKFSNFYRYFSNFQYHKIFYTALFKIRNWFTQISPLTCPLAVARFGGNLAAANWFAARAPPKGDENWVKFILGYCKEKTKRKRAVTHTHRKKVKLCENILIILQREIRDQLDRTIKLTKCRSHNFVDDIQIRLVFLAELTFDRELDLQANYLQIVLIVVHSVVLHAHFFFCFLVYRWRIVRPSRLNLSILRWVLISNFR